MTCRLSHWFRREPVAQDLRSVQAVQDSAESVRRNEARTPEVQHQTSILKNQLERNHLAERMTLAMRKAHRA